MSQPKTTAVMNSIDIDVGGTFTDFVLTLDGERHIVKAPTTPHDLSIGFLNAVESGAEKVGLTIDELLPRIDIVRYSTTVALNRLLQRQGLQRQTARQLHAVKQRREVCERLQRCGQTRHGEEHAGEEKQRRDDEPEHRVEVSAPLESCGKGDDRRTEGDAGQRRSCRIVPEIRP